MSSNNSEEGIKDIILEELRRYDELKYIDKKILLFYIKKFLIMYKHKDRLYSILENFDHSDKLLKNKYFKEFIKIIKREFHKNNYMFYLRDLKVSKKEEILRELNKGKDKEISDKLENFIFTLLENHRSTRERLDYYEILKERLSRELNIIERDTIIDLGCGYNPLKFIELLKFKRYLFVDLNKLDIEIISKILGFICPNSKIIGKDIDLYFQGDDLIKFINKFQINSHLVLMLKLLDNLENNKKNYSLNFLKRLILESNLKEFLISFSKISICGNKVIKNKKRSWFENFLFKNTDFYINVKKVDLENEVFYYIKVLN